MGACLTARAKTFRDRLTKRITPCRALLVFRPELQRTVQPFQSRQRPSRAAARHRVPFRNRRPLSNCRLGQETPKISCRCSGRLLSAVQIRFVRPHGSLRACPFVQRSRLARRGKRQGMHSVFVASGCRLSPASALQYPLCFADTRPAGSLAKVIARSQRRQLSRLHTFGFFQQWGLKAKGGVTSSHVSLPATPTIAHAERQCVLALK